MFSMVEANRAVHNAKKTSRKLIHLKIKTKPSVTWFIDIMRQIIKRTQGKQIFSITLIVHQNAY